MPRPEPAHPAPPIVTIHGIADARLALSLQSPLTLLSGPNAAAYAGPAWWRAVVALAVTEFGPAPDILDCGDNPAWAVEALRAGCHTLVLMPGPAWADIAGRAARQGASLLVARPPAFDPAGMHPRDARWHLAVWLRSANARAHNTTANTDGDGI